MKFCTKCKTDKPLTDFAKNKRSKDGLSYHCSDCRRQYREDTKDRRSKSHKKWIKNNQDKWKKYRKDWYDKNKEREQEAWRQRKIDPINRSRRLLNLARSRAKKSGLEFNLTKEWLLPKLEKGTCEVTNIPFTLSITGNGPFIPSLDRKNPKIGYTTDNTQLVIFCYNCAKGNWSHSDVIKMAKALTKD